MIGGPFLWMWISYVEHDPVPMIHLERKKCEYIQLYNNISKRILSIVTVRK